MPVSQGYADHLLEDSRSYWNSLSLGLFTNSSIPPAFTVLANYTQPASAAYSLRPIVCAGAPAGPAGGRYLEANPIVYLASPPTGTEFVNGWFLYDAVSGLVVVAALPDPRPQPVFGLATTLTITIRFVTFYNVT